MQLIDVQVLELFTATRTTLAPMTGTLEMKPGWLNDKR